MPNPIDMAGQKYGRLTAISQIGHINRARIWKFRCECGQDVSALGSAVRNGTTRSCGCLRRETTAKRKAVDLVGSRFDRLLVISACRDRNHHGCVRWSCACTCGKQTVATTAALTSGKKRSCGCIRREMMSALGSASKQNNPASQTKEYRRQIKLRRRSSPAMMLADRVSSAVYKALVSNELPKRKSTFELLGYSRDALRSHIERMFLPGMNWGNRSKWQIDHIVPISSATTEEDVIALNQLYNLRPLWSEENNAKKDKRLFLI